MGAEGSPGGFLKVVSKGREAKQRVAMAELKADERETNAGDLWVPAQPIQLC